MAKAPVSTPAAQESTELGVRLRGAQRRLVVIWRDRSVVRDLPASGRLTIGRDPSCDVRIDHRSVSRVHAILELGEDVQIEDAGSKNGTRAAGREVPAQTSVPWVRGTVAEIGEAVLVVHELSGRHDAGAPASSSPRGSGAMDRVRLLVDLVAKSTLSVILTGETGAGKEVVARRIHDRSPRAAGPFVALNCAALPDALLESELFGHERGAFTGALQSKRGMLEAANGGTLLLDELGELPLITQVKLLRALETREVTPVGGLKPRPFDARLVSATNRDLDALVEAGRFRLDLYFRLNGLSIQIPPLRERVDEIEPLARAFAVDAAAGAGRAPAAISGAALDVLRAHSWPGNVRELRNVVDRAMVLCAGDTIGPEHFVLQRLATAPRAEASGREGAAGLPAEMAALERRRIMDALERTAGNQTEAARALGVSRRTLVRRLAGYGLPRPRSRR
jgi:DNA-binding NtrC family response regulator